jgi:hypothetical protein
VYFVALAVGALVFADLAAPAASDGCCWFCSYHHLVLAMHTWENCSPSLVLDAEGDVAGAVAAVVVVAAVGVEVWVAAEVYVEHVVPLLVTKAGCRHRTEAFPPHHCYCLPVAGHAFWLERCRIQEASQSQKEQLASCVCWALDPVDHL